MTKKGSDEMFSPYYHERRRKRKRIFNILLISGAILMLVLLIVVFASQNTPTTTVLKQEKVPTLQKTATLKLSTLYACGHQKNRLLPLPDELEHKNQTEVLVLYPNWKILNFEEQLIEAEETVDTDCDNHFLLKLTNNKINVVKKNTPNEIIMEEKINISILTDEDKKILSSGISVNSEYELLEILESFR